MSSTWKLTKKLKETHISSAFLRGGNSPAPSTEKHEVLGSRSNTLVRDKDSSSAHSQTLSNSSPAAASAVAAAAAATAATGSEGSKQSQRDATITQGSVQRHSDNAASATVSSQTSSSSSQASMRSSTNPALLRVKVYDLAGLAIPTDIRERLPQWAFDKASTRPPPVHLVLDYDKTQIILHAIGGTVTEPVWEKTLSFDVSAKERVLSITVYVRVPQQLSDDDDAVKQPVLARRLSSENVDQITVDNSSRSNSTTQQPAKGQANNFRIEHVVIGSVRIDTAGPIEGWYPLAGTGGRLKIRAETHETRRHALSMDDFSLLKVVGKGSFGKVMQVRKKDTQQVYALKSLRKAHIVSRSEIGHTLAERTVLAKISNPFIVPLKFSFQSTEKLYLVLAFINGGELFHHLQREGRFDLNRSRFYTAELLCALECLHEYNVIYRDLKPENILLDYTGHIALCDFGLCKLNMAGQEKTNTFCGTPEYLAPELLLGQGYTKVVDFWTLGVLFYEMLTGLPPFYDQDTNKMYHKILQNPLVFPSDMDQEARSLLMGLLERDPERRLGVNGAAEIKAHPFFRQIDWKCLLNKKYAAPFQPSVSSAFDTSNFDQEFTNEVPMDSVVDKDFYLSESVQNQFAGWSYTNTDSQLASSGRW